MASIFGKVSFNSIRSATYDSTDPGIENVPVVLQDTASNLRLIVLTDVTGNFEFINVPDGSYRLVESYGLTGGVASPGDFSTAVAGSVPIGVDPPISFVSTAPVGATNLDSLSPNTLFITVEGSDVTEQYFLDGPIKYKSLIDPCATMLGPNLITTGDNGIFGTYSAGTAINYAPPFNPYPYITEGTMTYTTNITASGQYTLRNIYTDGNVEFWNLANKTTRDETSGMLVLDPSGTGSEVVFSQDVSVSQNTEYIFTFWISNLMKVDGYLDPNLSVQVLDAAGGAIIDNPILEPIPPNTEYPEWLQLGTTLNTGANSQITIRILSNASSGIGNDFVIDDVELVQISVPDFVPVKSVSKTVVLPDETFTYTVTLENTCQSSLTALHFQDNIPSGTIFIDHSVKINGTLDTTLDPQVGFNLDDIPGQSSLTISFDVKVLPDVSTIPSFTGEIPNTATLSYEYTPVQGGYSKVYNYTTNEVTSYVLSLDYLISQYIDFINNAILDLDCENILTSINLLIATLNNLLILTRDYILYILTTNTDISFAFKSQLERFLDALNAYISMTTSLDFTSICNNDVIAYLLSLMLELSLIIIRALEFLNGILSLIGKCECIGAIDTELLIAKFINTVTMLFMLSEDWRQILTWLYQNNNPVPNYVAAYVPNRPVLLPPPRPNRSLACVPCPPKPPCPPCPPSHNRYGGCGC